MPWLILYLLFTQRHNICLNSICDENLLIKQKNSRGKMWINKLIIYKPPKNVLLTIPGLGHDKPSTVLNTVKFNYSNLLKFWFLSKKREMLERKLQIHHNTKTHQKPPDRKKNVAYFPKSNSRDRGYYNYSFITWAVINIHRAG